MGNSRKSANKSENKPTQNQDSVEVLYQKMGDRWFAFSLIEDEVFVGSVTQHEIDAGKIESLRVKPLDKE